MTGTLKDKVVVVTGASSGIGAALAELLGARGARPVLVARRAKELSDVARRSGPEALAVTADVTRRDDVHRAFDTALARFGGVDAWVNNAGQGITRSVSDLTDEDLDDMMRINVKSALYGMQVVLPHFRERNSGHIVNVSSLLGRMPLAPFSSAYSASKHALNALTAKTPDDRYDPPEHPRIERAPRRRRDRIRRCARAAGGADSRPVPRCGQSAEEVAAVIAKVLESPRADVYTRDGAQQMIVAYYAAEDMGRAERELRRSFRCPPAR